MNIKKYISFILFLLLFSPLLKAQQIKGRIIDEKGNAIEFSNVVILNETDSSFIEGTISKDDGSFVLTYPSVDGDYLLSVSYVGYTKVNKHISNREIGDIILSPESIFLEDVVIKGNLPKFEMSNEGISTNVQSSLLKKAGTANDVLKKLPNVTGDNGNYMVFGKGDAKIFINDREMRDASILDNLSSQDLKNIEVVFNPGAQYDATVKAVIRITTIKKVGDGFGFDVRSSYFQSENTDLIEQMNMNYRKNRLDLFASLKYTRISDLQQSDIEQTVYADTLWTLRNNMKAKKTSNTFYGKGGLNYSISTEHSLGMEYSVYLTPQYKEYSSMSSDVLADGVSSDHYETLSPSTEKKNPAHLVNLYYNGKFDHLSVDYNMDYIYNSQNSISDIQENSSKTGTNSIYSVNDVKNKMLASKLVLGYPVWGGNLNIGSEYTNTKRNDNYFNEDTSYPSSYSLLKEKNISAFAEYAGETFLGKLAMGIRYEHTQFDYYDKGELIENQSRKYDNWYPHISLASKINKVTLLLSYNAKTQRPTYRQLSNNVSYGNRFLLQTGNPLLKPSVNHDISLVGMWKFFQLMASYQHINDDIIYWAEQNENNEKISVISHKNIDKRNRMTFALVASPTIGIWEPSLTVACVKQWYSVMMNGKMYNINKPVCQVEWNNSIELPQDILLTTDIEFQSKGHHQNIYISKSSFKTNIGISKSFLNKSLDVSIKGKDLFKSQKDAYLIYHANMNFYQGSTYDNRELELTVRYKFNTVRSKYKGKGAGNSEKNRLK